MARISVTIEAENISDYYEALRHMAGVLPADDIENIGDDRWTEETIHALWLKLADDAKLVLGIIADAMVGGSEFISRQDLFGEIKKYPDATVKMGTGFGGTLSSYGFAARSLGLRDKNEKLYLSDEAGYTMRKEYASIVLTLFVNWLKANNKSKP